MAGLRGPARTAVTGVVVVAAAAAPWLPSLDSATRTGAASSASTSIAATVTTRDLGRTVTSRPLAAVRSGIVTQSSTGGLGLVPLAGGNAATLTAAQAPVTEAWGCATSFVGLQTTEVSGNWQTSVVWVDTATRQTTRRTVPRTQRVLGATPRGFAVADVNTGTTAEVQGASGSRTDLAPFADSWACDDSGYAWTQSAPGAWTEKALRRSWSAVTATPSLLVESEKNLRVLSLSGTTALVSDSRRDWQTTRPSSVVLQRVAAGSAPVALWSGGDAVLEGAVASGTATYIRVTDRSSGAVVGRTLVRDGSGAVRSVAVALPGPSAPTPLAATSGGGAVLAVDGSAGGLWTLGGSSPVRVASWASGVGSRGVVVRR